MVARHGEVHRVVDQVAQLDALEHALELGRRHPAVLEHERDLELRGAQHLHGVLGLLLDEGELHLRVALGEERHGRRQQRGAGAREGRHPHAAAAHAGDRLELGLRRGEPRDDDLGVLDERLPGVGEPHAAAAAVDERRPGALLERRDLL